MSLTYTQEATLPDGRPCTLTWAVLVIKLDASQGGGLGCDELELVKFVVGDNRWTGDAAHYAATHVEAGDNGAWYDARSDEAFDALDSDTLREMLIDDYGGPD